MNEPRRRTVIGLLSLAIFVFVGTAYHFSFFDTIEEKINDRFFLSHPTPNDIIIVAIDDESIRAIGQWPWRRSVFAQMIDVIGNARAIGIDVNFFEPSRFGSTDDVALANAFASIDSRVVLPVQTDAQTGELLAPLPLFQDNAQFGSTDITVDSDGVVRQLVLADREVVPLGVAVVGERLPHDAGGTVRIDYHGPEHTFLTVPFIDVLEGRVPDRIFSNNIVLVGATAPDLQDFFSTPFGRMSGVEVHANIASTVREPQLFQEIPPVWGSLAILLSIFAVSAAVFYVKKFSVLVGILGALFILVQALAFGLFEFKVTIPHFYLSLGVVLTGGLTISYQYITESKEKRFIRRTFQYYLAPEVIDELTKKPDLLKPGGERRKVTVLFSDLRDFTAISESLGPEEIMARLNEYFEEMSDAVLSTRGLVDKYIGDSLMSYWGAPVQNDTQAVDACRAIAYMIERLKALNGRWQKKGWAAFRAGFGVSTEEVIVGNTGSSKRFDYSLVGDGVNFASRLEGLNKVYGTTALISDTTQREIVGRSDFITRELDLVAVKGKKEARLIFELLIAPLDENKKEALMLFADGRKWYQEGLWEKAINAFTSALVAAPDDGPSKVFLERSRALKDNPPERWDGVFEAATK